MKAVLANLGFIFQIAGVLTLPSILVGFYYNEINAVISFFITATVYFFIGFLLNALSERKRLSFKSSCILLSMTFFFLAIVNSIPYLYLNIFSDPNPLVQFTNSYLEAVSGQTTTGITLIKDVESLPQSMILFRGLSQWVGGMSIIFILLSFLYPEKSIVSVGKVIGLIDGKTKIKKTFSSILTIQFFYIVVFSLLFYFIGSLTHPIQTVSMVISSIAAGGIKPVNDMSTILYYPNNVILCVLMVIAATSFTIHRKLFAGKFKSAFTKEFWVFLFIIFFAVFILNYFAKWDLQSAFFHVISASTSSGYSLLDFTQLSELTKFLFISLMFIGGMSFSPANGIRVARLLMFVKSIPWVIKNVLTGKEEPFVFNGKEVKTSDFYLNIAYIILAGFFVILCAVIFSLEHFPFTDSLFESVTLFTNTGIPFNVLTITSPLYLKWLAIFMMILGRIEIFPFLIAFSSYPKEEKPKEEKLSLPKAPIGG